MPLYELFCLARPKLADPILHSIIKKAAVQVLGKGGVLLNVSSYGDTDLAYTIRPSKDEILQQAAIWRLEFAASPVVLKEMEHDLRVEENVLRWIITKKKQFPNLPKLTQLFYIPELDNPNRKRRSPVYPPESRTEHN